MDYCIIIQQAHNSSFTVNVSQRGADFRGVSTVTRLPLEAGEEVSRVVKSY